MRFIPQVIPDIILIKPSLQYDVRGYFMETYRQELFNKFLGYNLEFVQENESKSKKGVLRGLHYQAAPFSQAKLIRVISGSILDVVVDIRRSSNTFGQYLSIKLDAENKEQLFIPPGFAHGFVTLTNNAIFSYKLDKYYSSEHERGIAYDDKELAINWHFSKDKIILSERDKKNPLFHEAKDLI